MSNPKTREELDKIAMDTAQEAIVETVVDQAMNKIAEGFIMLGNASLQLNDVDVQEKTAAGEIDENTLIETGKVAFDMLIDKYADDAFAEQDAEAHAIYHEAKKLAFDEKLAELGVSDFLATNEDNEKVAVDIGAIASKLRTVLSSSSAAMEAKSTATQLLQKLQAAPQEAMAMISQHPALAAALGIGAAGGAGYFAGQRN